MSKKRGYLIIALVVAVLIFLTTYSFLISYSTTASCSVQQVTPQWNAHTENKTISYVEIWSTHEFNTSITHGYGHIGVTFSATISYTTAVTESNATVSLYNGYGNESCTYVG